MSGTFDYRLGGAIVWLMDLEAAQEGSGLVEAGPAWAEAAWASEPPEFAPAGGFDTVRVSDLGWKGDEAYPPLLSSGPNIERRVALSPFASDTFAWGAVRISYPGIAPGTELAGRDTAMRNVTLRAGVKGWDLTRGYVTDPAELDLVDAFKGLALPWQPVENGADVGLRDPSAWLNAQIGVRKYLGTGGAEGPADLAGTPWPLVRGGSASFPVRSCPVTLLDSATRLYRWSDVGTVVQVFEDGVAVYTNAGSVANCALAGSPGAGAFYHDAIGQIKLGSDPAGTVTVDGYGAVSSAATVLRNLLVDSVGLPTGLLDEDSVTDTATIAPYVGGWAWTGQETAREAIVPLLAALNARLISSRSGGLKLWPLRTLSIDAVPVFSIDTATAVSVVPVALDAPLMPPAAVWTVGYGKTHTLITTPKPTVTPAERERLSRAFRTTAWTDTANLARYAQPSRPDMVQTALLSAANAVNLVDKIGELWGRPRQLWQVTLPLGAVLLRDIGDVVSITWPADGLRTGALGQVVGDSVRAGSDTASMLVLV